MATLEGVPAISRDHKRQDSYDEKSPIDKEDKESLHSGSDNSEPVAVWEDVADSKEKIIGKFSLSGHWLNSCGLKVPSLRFVQ